MSQEELIESQKLISNLCKHINQLNEDKAKIICELRDQIINNEKLIEKNNLLIKRLEDKVSNKYSQIIQQL